MLALLLVSLAALTAPLAVQAGEPTVWLYQNDDCSGPQYSDPIGMNVNGCLSPNYDGAHCAWTKNESPQAGDELVTGCMYLYSGLGCSEGDLIQTMELTVPPSGDVIKPIGDAHANKYDLPARSYWVGTEACDYSYGN